MAKILVVDDAAFLRMSLKKILAAEDHMIYEASNGVEAITLYQEIRPDVVTMDITMPDMDGLEALKRLKQIDPGAKVIMCSAMGQQDKVVTAIQNGAIDFIAKPFDFGVLMAKIQALLRRSYDFSNDMPVLEHKGAMLHTGEQVLLYGDEKIELTKNEYRILHCLMENKGQVVSREKLMQRLWETDNFVDENTLTVNVNRLRKKLSQAGLQDFITTKFGVGYII